MITDENPLVGKISWLSYAIESGLSIREQTENAQAAGLDENYLWAIAIAIKEYQRFEVPEVDEILQPLAPLFEQKGEEVNWQSQRDNLLTTGRQILQFYAEHGIAPDQKIISALRIRDSHL